LSAAVLKTFFPLAGNGRVLLDERREHAPLGLDAQRERRYIEEQHVLPLAGEHRTLDGRTYRDDFIGIHALMRLLFE